MNGTSALLETMSDAARAAGSGLLEDFARVGELTVSSKGTADFFSAADLRAQATIRTRLAEAFPRYGFIGEEDARDAAADGRHVWIVDPLDGTTNFLHGLPHFAVSIALERDGELIAAAVYDPPKNEMFLAEKGAGAYANGKPMRVSSAPNFDEAILATGVPHRGRGDHPAYLKLLSTMMGEFAGIRRFGAAALDLAYVAAGRFDAFFEFGLARWDVAGGALLVREAGGRVTDVTGGTLEIPHASVLASNGVLHDAVAALLAK